MCLCGYSRLCGKAIAGQRVDVMVPKGKKLAEFFVDDEKESLQSSHELASHSRPYLRNCDHDDRFSELRDFSWPCYFIGSFDLNFRYSKTFFTGLKKSWKATTVPCLIPRMNFPSYWQTSALNLLRAAGKIKIE